jgi:hypothetical protein
MHRYRPSVLATSTAFARGSTRFQAAVVHVLPPCAALPGARSDAALPGLSDAVASSTRRARTLSISSLNERDSVLATHVSDMSRNRKLATSSCMYVCMYVLGLKPENFATSCCVYVCQCACIYVCMYIHRLVHESDIRNLRNFSR